ncbi:MAG: glycosyltransferase family 9 protein [Flavobacteriales bacterium]|nr:glycosyltransferase family 9 protein [Flavobacteriales bacterium]
MEQILIIQTAYIGDAILATALVESIRATLKDAEIDFVVRKGNEGLLTNHPEIRKVFVWDKKNGKYKNLNKLIREIRQTEYDALFNLQRYASSGYISWRAKARFKAGYAQNPLSFCYSTKVQHEMQSGRHEVERNLEVLNSWSKADFDLKKPKLYPSKEDYQHVSVYQEEEYYVMAPSSVWFTKQLPKHKWIELIQKKYSDKKIYLIGGGGDQEKLEEIRLESESNKVINLAGQLNLLQSTALIDGAQRTFVNDSAPLHLASACNAPVTAFFCSTIPQFGFGPLSDDNQIKEATVQVHCRPCGLHGQKSCPKGHFRCANEIDL